MDYLNNTYIIIFWQHYELAYIRNR